MPTPRSGDTVKVHYTGRLDDGRVFDSSRDREPLEVTIGEGRVIPGFEEALTRMEPGEQATVVIPADQAYGPHRPDLMVAVAREQFPDHIQPEVGLDLHVRQENGDVAVVRVAEVTERHVTLDANHPLAGENLTFDLELVSISGPGRR